jgi:hypothetical protein
MLFGLEKTVLNFFYITSFNGFLYVPFLSDPRFVFKKINNVSQVPKIHTKGFSAYYNSAP